MNLGIPKKSLTVFLVKAFSQDKNFGNPAGVILNAASLSDEQMLAITRELGFSESAFVSASDKADFRVRFFSTKQEVDFCGHATIATFHILIEQGKITFGNTDYFTVTQETKAGVLPVTCHRDGRVVMTQNSPEFGPVESDRGKIANLLGIPPDALLAQPIQVVSTGTPKLIIPVDSLKTLQAITPDLEGIAACVESRGFYPFTSETIDPQADFQARQFNPAVGINEDPLTGVAAGALGCYAKKYKLVNKDQIIIEQGYNMNMGGQMFVDVSDDVKVGGYGVTFGEKIF